MAIGDLISAIEYNNIRDKIVSILGSGSGSSGYGQVIQSSTVSQSDVVTALQWNSLRADIFNTLVHQSDSLPSSIFTPAIGGLVRFGTSFPVTQYDALSDTAILNKFNIGVDQFAIEGGTSNTGAVVSRTANWSSAVSTTVTVTFASAAEARYFFNSGGKIQFTSAFSKTLNNAQNIAWENLLSGAGTRQFGGNTPAINFYNLTNSYQTLYTTSSSIPYASNSYILEVLSNVANNSNGTATQLTFKASWIDSYVDPDIADPAPEIFPPDDLISGTLTLTVNQLRAVGDLYNAAGQVYAAFTVSGPSLYSAQSITGS